MTAVNERFQPQFNSFMQRLANWQSMRWLWLSSALVALTMNLIAHFIFQDYMNMSPCEKCVYIRYAMFCIVLAGLVAAINPRNLYLRLVGYGITLYGAIFGLIWSWQLVESYRMMNALDSGMDPFAAGLGFTSCSVEAVYHFGLPLDVWFPSWFAPTGVCGADTWSFLGLDMGSWTLVIFSVYIILVTLSILATLLKGKTTAVR
jgi:disulfide bond formation protein DsbB